MENRQLYMLFQEIFSIFGRQAPSENSHQFTTFVSDEIINQLPSKIYGYIIDHFKELDSLPQNLIKAVRGIWYTYKTENPQQIYVDGCPICGGEGYLDCWEKTKDFHGNQAWRHFNAFCPECQTPREGYHFWSPKQWQQHGVLVCPYNFPGGILEFEYQHNIRERPEPNPHIHSIYNDIIEKMQKSSTYNTFKPSSYQPNSNDKRNAPKPTHPQPARTQYHEQYSEDNFMDEVPW